METRECNVRISVADCLNRSIIKLCMNKVRILGLAGSNAMFIEGGTRGVCQRQDNRSA